MIDHPVTIRRALIGVSDKSGVAEIAAALQRHSSKPASSN